MARKLQKKPKKPAKPPTAVTSIRILADAYNKLCSRADKRGVSIRQVMREILEAAA